jgi:hypothetical protein
VLYSSVLGIGALSTLQMDSAYTKLGTVTLADNCANLNVPKESHLYICSEGICKKGLGNRRIELLSTVCLQYCKCIEELHNRSEVQLFQSWVPLLSVLYEQRIITVNTGHSNQCVSS